MDEFTQMYLRLDATTKTTNKLLVLKSYFGEVSEADTLWALWLLSGNTVRRAVTSTQLKDWAADAGRIPRWLFDESYIRVGDLAETVSMVITQNQLPAKPKSLAEWMTEISNLRQQPETSRRTYIESAWHQLDGPQRYLFTKLITGAFRVGVSRGLTVRALASHIGADAPVLLHALTGDWNPVHTSLDDLTSRKGSDVHPYPFFLASPVGDITTLGAISDWQCEWKWDGIRGQMVHRGELSALWSRGEELVSEQFPELMALVEQLPSGTVLDGEIMPWQDGPLSFALLQTRLGRKTVTPKLLADAPVAFVAYDILELGGNDVRELPLELRRQKLGALISEMNDTRLILSPSVDGRDWPALASLQASARERKAEGLMLKRKASPYRVGRVRGDWWKWKVAPLSVDAVMINAQRGHGRRSEVYSDYTFAVWDGDILVPFAKAYSGLTDAEIRIVDKFVKKHTLEKFGPVRTVEPEMVFEIGFEGIAASKRHKSGVAVRFPRILRPRPDKPVSEIDTVTTLQELLRALS